MDPEDAEDPAKSGISSSSSRMLHLNSVCTVLLQQVKDSQAAELQSEAEGQPNLLERTYRHQSAFDIDNFIKRTYKLSIPFGARAFPGTIFMQNARSTRCPLPSFENMLRFMRTMFQRLGINTECAIIALIYLDRLKELNAVCLDRRNWRPLILAALLTCSKVWDDVSLWNVEFHELFPIFAMKDINLLERRFLEALQYDLHISSSIYAKYFFFLRSVRVRSAAKAPVQYSQGEIPISIPKYYVPLNASGRDRNSESPRNTNSVQVPISL